MKKIFILLSLSIVCISVLVIAQHKTIPLHLRWEKVNEYAEKQLPESALREVEAIIEQAQKENNSIELIKATVYKMRFILTRDPDKLAELIVDFEKFSTNHTDPAEKALLLSMTAELYANHYSGNARNIDKRTPVEGYIARDINEWSGNTYYAKICNLLHASTLHAGELQKTDAIRFAGLLEEGPDSRHLMPSLFDFLSYRKIDLLTRFEAQVPIKNPLLSDAFFADANEFIALKPDSLYKNSIENEVLLSYQQLLSFHLSKSNIQALIFTDLERLNYVHQKTQKNESYLKALTALEKNYRNNESVVEVLIVMAGYYLNSANENAENKQYRKLAYELCSDGIRRFPNYKRIDLLKNIQKTISRQQLSFSHNGLAKPDTKLTVKINAANTEALEIRVYKVNATAMDYFTFKQNKTNQNDNYPSRTLIEKTDIKLKTDPCFGAVDTTLKLITKSYGIYEITMHAKDEKNDDKISTSTFVVSDFGYIQRANVANLQQLYILDRQSGLQQPDVDVSIYEPKWTGNGYRYELKAKSRSDKKGSCNIPFSTNYGETKIFLERGRDKFFSSESYVNYYDQSPGSAEEIQNNLFTDRALYRPGQTVYFKGIAWVANKKRQEVAVGEKFEISLYDQNNRKLSSKSLTTNAFGSLTGEFVLPQSGLNGAYRLQMGTKSQNIWVEEYKRPTFELRLEKPKAEIRFGEMISMHGTAKAFAGYGIGNAKVKFRVIRTRHRLCWWWDEPEKEIANGFTVTNAEGKFEMLFIAEKPTASAQSWRGNSYTYTAKVELTDTKGETQQGEQSLSVGDKSLFIIAGVPAEIEKDAGIGFDISTETINGERLDAELDYEIFALAELTDYRENSTSEIEPKITRKMMAGKYFTGNKKLNINTSTWKSGQYKICLGTRDAFGNEVKTENRFVIYSASDKRPAVKTYVWMLAPETTCAVGEKAILYFGTSTAKTAVLYEIMQGNKVLVSKWMKFNNEIKKFEIPFKEAYGGGITVQFTFMKDEKLFSQSVEITARQSNKNLSPTLSVFRNKLLPGEKAEWTINLPETKNTDKTAELLVAMYDASLDAIRPHAWYFSPVFHESLSYSPPWTANNFSQQTAGIYFEDNFRDVEAYRFDRLNWFGLELNQNYNYGYLRRTTAPGMILEENDLAIVSDDAKPALPLSLRGKIAGVVVQETGAMANFEIADKAQTTQTKTVHARKNFNETAFFYPQLRTDAQGNVKFSFTAPESLTRWNVKMLAHTPDLYFGQAQAELITAKELMVQMNLPRFVRQSDKLLLTANVTNLTEKELKTRVNFALIVPETENSIPLNDAAEKEITLAAGETKAVEFKVTEFSPFELVICKMVASAGNFSDGEQKYLPVLPDKILVTENLALVVRGNQTRTFRFENLIKNGLNVENRNLALEFSSNPAWYAVQALPALSTPESNNAVELFSAYYANSLAAYIANSNPAIAATFEQWKKTSGSRDALLSNLEQNSELKNILLEETPWLTDAKDETEQKRRIALLFDLNMQKNLCRQQMELLQKFQLPSGAFSWFMGMPENRHITLEILLNLARLKKITGTDDFPLSAVNKALYYLDLEMARDFDRLKKNRINYQKENCIDNTQIFYLHMRSEYPEIPVHVSAQEALQFYSLQAEKYWTDFSLYGKAMMAMVANRNGKVKLAATILKSLKENALKTDELGMYWTRNVAGYYWNERPVSVQAAIIEAFNEISKDNSELDEMKIWLLKQKQTQRWDDPVASVNAIYALLLQGSNWLTASRGLSIDIGNKTLEPSTSEAGTGYFKESFSAADIKSSMGNIRITKTDNNIGWGAMYWQYFRDIQKIEARGAALQISKKLFVERINAGTKSMVPIELSTVQKGDKVITRLVLSTDRNLEYVALKDFRASCFEPLSQTSGCKWKEGLCYYQTTKDASTQFFFHFLPKGTYVFEYELWVNNSGEFSSGIASVQCQYAPEFASHTSGQVLQVK